MSKTNIYLVAIFITKLMKSSKTQVGIKRKRSRRVFQRCESAKRFKIRRQKRKLLLFLFFYEKQIHLFIFNFQHGKINTC